VIVVLAYPYLDPDTGESHPPESSPDLPDLVARQLIRDGHARAPDGVDYQIDMFFDGYIEGADGDLMRMRQAADQFRPEVAKVIDRLTEQACAWSLGREPLGLVNTTCCETLIVTAGQTPFGTLVLNQVRDSDIDGYIVRDGRRIPVGISGPMLGHSPRGFVREPLRWAGVVLPWPAPLPQPRTVRARCRHGGHVVNLSELRQVLATAVISGKPKRMRSTVVTGG